MSGAAGSTMARVKRAARSIYTFVLLLAAIPILLLTGMLFVLEDRIVDVLARELVAAQLCTPIKDMRVALAYRLNEANPINEDEINGLLRRNSPFDASSFRRALRVGPYGVDNLDTANPQIIGHLQYPDMHRSDGARIVQHYIDRTGTPYTACVEYHDLSGKRLKSYEKIVYIYSIPDDDLEDAVANFTEILKNAHFLYYVITAITIALLFGVAGFQLFLTYGVVETLGQDIKGVQSGREDRLPRRHYPSEIKELVAEFNHILSNNDKNVAYTRQIVKHIAHDINNKLQAFMTLSKGVGPQDMTMQRLVAGMKSEVDRYSQMAAASGEMGDSGARRKRFDLVPFVHELFAIQQLYPDNQGKLYILTVEGEEVVRDAVCAPTLWALSHKGDLEIIFSNLLHNFSKYGKDMVEVSMRRCSERRAVLIDVDDDGPGIPLAKRAEIFQYGMMINPDQQLPGSGFGLHNVEMIVESLEGSITVSDSPLGGARFHMELPILSKEA